MGNLTGSSSGPPKYYTNKEAINILGDETWVRLRKQLERFARSGRYVDYQLFSRILYRRYERMVTTYRHIHIPLSFSSDLIRFIFLLLYTAQSIV